MPWDTGIPADKAEGLVHAGSRARQPARRGRALPCTPRPSGTRRHIPPSPRGAVSREAVVRRGNTRRGRGDSPDEAALAAAALGGPPPKVRRRKVEASPLRVSVMHGHLKFADWPVMVGHYKGDTIVSAEKVLDPSSTAA